MKHKTLQSNQGNIHYWIHKSHRKNAELIVFTHGVTADNTMFGKQVEFFKHDYSILTWDVPMHGRSRPYDTFSYENNAKQLKSILEAENITQVVLVGMSNGGYTSQEFAHQYPENVRGLVAIDTTPFGLKYYTKLDKMLFSLFASCINLIPEKLLRHTMAKSSSKTDYGYSLMKSMHSKLSKSEIVNLASNAYISLMKENKDVNFDFPVWILLGEHDKALKVNKYSHMWAMETGYPLKIIPNAAHLSNADNFKEVNKVIHQFLLQL